MQGQDPTNQKKPQRGKRKDSETAGVMLIPVTPGSELKNKLQKMDRNLPFQNKCKYVEEAGTTILNTLF